MAHDAPPSVVRITARNRLLAAHPFRPTKYRSEICPCSTCCWKLQLYPPSTLPPVKTPPPEPFTWSTDDHHKPHITTICTDSTNYIVHMQMYSDHTQTH